MSAYVIYLGDVLDEARHQSYKEAVEPNILAGGGRYVVRGGDTDLLEGTLPAGRSVILEFPRARPRSTSTTARTTPRSKSCARAPRAPRCTSSTPSIEVAEREGCRGFIIRCTAPRLENSLVLPTDRRPDRRRRRPA